MDEGEQLEQSTSLRGSKEVIAVLRRHWIALDRGLLFLLLAAIGFVVGSKLNARAEIIVAIFVVFGLLFFSQFVSWWFSVSILTNSGLEVVNQKGLFKRGVVDIPFESIINTNYATKGLLQAALGFGTIVIQTQSGDIVLERIPKPAEVHKVMVVNYNKFRGFDE